jgi:hypothetical protein
MATKVKHLTGNVYGQLIVIGQTERINGRSYSLCKCSCGNTKRIDNASLTQGHTKACGCLRGTKSNVGYGVSAFNTCISSYRRGAKIRGLPFLLTEEVFRAITQSDCYYCGSPPQTGKTRKRKSFGVYVYNGVDRVDNTMGYIEGNVVPCCKVCNRIKGVLTQDEFLSHIKNIYTHSMAK